MAVLHSQGLALRACELVAAGMVVAPGTYCTPFCHLHNGEWQTEHGSESLAIVRDHRKGHRDHRLLNMPSAMQGIMFDGVENA